jgi:hypothetical protein
MKANQAWGWLAAGVLAAGLNANYYDGGLQWAHRIANRVGPSSAAVLALATEQADQFLAQTELLNAHVESASYRLATTLASLQNTIAKRTTGESARETDSFELVSVRPEVQFVKLEAKRTRMEHETAARAVHFRLAPAALAPVVVRPLPAPVVCSRVRVNIPQVPMIKMPTVKMPTIKMPAVPTIRIETDSDGPI